MSRETIRPAPDDARASGVFSQRLRQHVLVECEIGDQTLQPIVFVLELPQAAELAHAQVRVLLLPGVEGGLTDPQLPADVPDRGAALGLAQGVGHLLLGEFRALHRSRPFWVDRRRRHFTLVLGCRCFWGRRHAEAAEDLYRGAIARAEGSEMRPLVAQCQLGLGMLYTRTGAHERARQHLTTARTMFQDMRLPFSAGRTEAALKDSPG